MFRQVMRYAILALTALLFQTACVTLEQNEAVTSALPTESEVAEKLAKASFPRQLREPIIRLHHANPVERAQAAYQLAKLGRGAAPAVPYLIRLLQDETPVLLSRYLGGGFTDSAETSPAEEASRALARIGDPAATALILALKDTNPGVRRLSAKALGQIGEVNAVEFLIALLDDPVIRVRATAALALGSYRHPQAAQKIMEAYPKASVSARADMIYALAHINDIIAVPFLVERVPVEEPNVRAAIFLSLGQLRDIRSMPVLLGGLSDKDEIARANAAYALGAYFSPAVIEGLIVALQDSSLRVQEAATESLTALTGMHLGREHNKWQDWWQRQKKEMQPKQ